MEHVHRGTIGTVYSLLDGDYEFIEAKILEKSELVNKKIRDSNLPEDIRIGAVLRKDQVIIPRSNFIFEKDLRYLKVEWTGGLYLCRTSKY